MKRSHALALSGVALFLTSATSSYAQAVRPGQQCEPAVANASSMYGNCRLRIVQGAEVCRCAILPQALRRMNQTSDRDSAVTGSIGAVTPALSGPRGPVGASNWTGSPSATDDRSNGNVGTSSVASGSQGASASDGSAVGSIGGANAGGGVSGGNAGAGNTGGGRGNPGNDNAVGNAGESPNGGSFGGGSHGRSDADSKGGNGRGNDGGGKGDHGGGHGNNGYGNGGGDGSPNGKDDSNR
jgi:hypothetical protein